MSSGRHTVVIELEADGGSPRGWISIDKGDQRAFYGWIDLTAHLESLVDGLAGAANAPGAPVTRGA